VSSVPYLAGCCKAVMRRWRQPAQLSLSVFAFACAWQTALGVETIVRRELRSGIASNGSNPSLADVAIGLVSGRPEYFRPAASAVLRWLPKGVLLKAEGKCPCNFRAGFKALKTRHPDAKWYYVGDEDAFIMVDRLAEMLANYNPHVPTFMSGYMIASYRSECGGASPFAGRGACFFGGTGFIVSTALMKELLWDDAPCTKHGLLDSDIEFSCYLGRKWNHTWTHIALEDPRSGFGNFPNLANDLTAEHPSSEQVVVHHVDPKTLEELASRNAIVGKPSKGVEDVLAEAILLKGGGCSATAVAANTIRIRETTS